MRPSRPTRSPPRTKMSASARPSTSARSIFGACARSDDVAHRGGAVDPEPDGVRRLPFALAHIEPVVAGGAAPVDALRGLAGDEGAELPEALAGRRPAGGRGCRAAAVAATRRASSTSRGSRCASVRAASVSCAPRRARAVVEDPDAGHDARSYPRRAARRGGGSALGIGLALGARGEGQRHAVLEHRLGQRHARRRARARAGPRSARGRARPASAPGSARGPGPQSSLSVIAGSALAGARRRARGRGSPRRRCRRPAGGARGAARSSAPRRS